MVSMITLIDLKTGERARMPASAAADIAELDEGEMLWALEEHGQCETDLYLIIETDHDA